MHNPSCIQVWGVGAEEQAHHVVHGWHLTQPYRVGVLTANEGYLLPPIPALRGANVSDYSTAPAGARLVDDIYMAGRLAGLAMERWVVPAAAPNVLVARSLTLDDRIAAQGTTRAAANTATLIHFECSWEDDLWYRFGGCRGPAWASWARRAAAKARKACVHAAVAVPLRLPQQL